MENHAHPSHHVNRVEDRRLITGHGKYAADWNAPNQHYAYFVRADRAHAEIIAIDVAAARAQPGVQLVLTGEDAVRAGHVNAPHALTFKGRNNTDTLPTPRPALASGRVRFVGEPVAMVVADSAARAQDAAELINIEYRDLPAVPLAEDALAPGAPQLHDSVPGNLPLECETGDEKAVAAGFAQAAHITRLKVESTRVVANPLELRACLVAFDAKTGVYRFNVCNQGTTMLRRQMSAWTNVPEDKLIFESEDIGGGFGQRTVAYPEYCALMLATQMLGRPVKWVATRVECFLCDTHGRSNIIDGQLALDASGKFLAMRLDWINDMGAYLSPGAMGHIRNTMTCMTGVYRIPALYGSYRVALTNATPVGSYRGAGRPDIAYVVERLVNAAARELNIDAAELRRRNFIAPEAFPYKTPTGSTYEIADLPGMLQKALKLSDWNGFEKRRAQSAATGKLRGIGISSVIENTGAGQMADEVEITLDASGMVTVHTVAKAQGHGHETTYAMIVSKALGLPLERIKIVQCLPGMTIKGNHTGGSRSTVGAGSVCHLAAGKLIEHGKSLAALEMKLEPSQIAYANGVFTSTQSKQSIELAALAKNAAITLKADGSFGSTFPNGCHIAEVEVDAETGVTEVVSYCAVDDCGEVIHHAIVEGQLHGGVMQGAGQVFGEHVVYDRESGQPLAASFMDYVMPRAGLIREIRGEEHPTPSKISPLGVKGVGESGCTASIPVLVGAVLDALRPLGITHLDMPLTPSRLWQAMQAARAKS